MFRNYLTVALRALRKRPGYAFINVAGLSVGLAAALLIFLYARHELTYDRFHENADRIHQVYKERVTPTGTQITRDTWVPLLDRMAQTFPEVEGGVRIWTTGEWVQQEQERFEEIVTYTDPSLFEVFSFALEHGDPATVLEAQDAVVLSQPMARKYFGEVDPMGQTLMIDTLAYRVTGVLAPIPTNSSIRIDFAVPLMSDPDYAELQDEWGTSFLDTYVLLGPNAASDRLEARFPAFVADIWDTETASRTHFRLEALPDLYNALTHNRRTAYILLGIALAILLIGIINFTNLATARSLERAREIGMRKTLGAGRGQLVKQFLGESVVTSYLALILGFGLAQIALPIFNDVYDLELALTLRDPLLLIGLPVLGLLVGLLAGSYPALYISGFKPVNALHGSLKSSPSGSRLRHALVITQFALSIALIAGTLIVRKQILHMQQADLGFDQSSLIAISVEVEDFADREQAQVRLETFKRELAQHTGVLSVASSAQSPGDGFGSFLFIRPEGWEDRDPLRMRWSVVDARYFETMGIPLREGRSFAEDRPADAEAVLLNAAALRAFGWETSEGKTVRLGSSGQNAMNVIGVVEDYHYASLREAIEPVVHFYRPPENAIHSYLAVRVRPEQFSETLAFIETRWERLDPNRPLPYDFMDARFAQLYEAEHRLGLVAGTFTLLGILVACLGLLGLAAWTAAQRIKEVGIRKVLGASVPNVVMLLSKDFLKLVVLALALGVPVAYVVMQRWLETFAYPVDLGVFEFGIAGGVALLIAGLTVSLQALRAALADPVDSLRYE